MNSEWSKEKLQELISYYQNKTVLWDPKDPHYFSRLKKNEAWEEIANNVAKPIELCKKKMVYLLAALRREKQKIKKSQAPGKGPNEVYKSTWFAFESMKFLLDKNFPHRTLRTFKRETVENDTIGQDNEEESETPDFSFIEPSDMTSTPPPINRKRKAHRNDDQLGKAFKLLQARGNAESDESQSFGNFVAVKLRTFDEDVRTQLQADIMGLFLKARRGFYGQPTMRSESSNDPLQLGHYSNIPSTSSAASDSLSDDSLDILDIS